MEGDGCDADAPTGDLDLDMAGAVNAVALAVAGAALGPDAAGAGAGSTGGMGDLEEPPKPCAPDATALEIGFGAGGAALRNAAAAALPAFGVDTGALCAGAGADFADGDTFITTAAVGTAAGAAGAFAAAGAAAGRGGAGTTTGAAGGGELTAPGAATPSKRLKCSVSTTIRAVR